MFLDFLRAGLAYRKESWVNWDPVDQTVLANEQVVDGRGWRTGAAVEKRLLSQWFLRITDFADDLREALSGSSAGPSACASCRKTGSGARKGRGLLSAADRSAAATGSGSRSSRRGRIRLFGASFCALAPNHPLAQRRRRQSGARRIHRRMQSLGTSEAVIETAEKKGVDTGITELHPLVPGCGCRSTSRISS